MKNQNLKNYVIEMVLERVKEEKENVIIKNNDDVLKYVNNVFYIEMLKYNNMYKLGKISRLYLFKEWIMGLCFISPIGENDLTPFTHFENDYIKQEKDILNKLIAMYYISDEKYFQEIITSLNPSH